MTKPRSFNMHDGKVGSALAIRVLPRSSRNEIVGVMEDGTVKIRLTSPPVDGKANQALIDYLSDILGVAKSTIDIVAGTTGRNKIVSILDIDSETIDQKIREQIK